MYIYIYRDIYTHIISPNCSGGTGRPGTSLVYLRVADDEFD